MTTTPAITMRDAQIDDCDRVFAWNCTPEVRAMSGDPRIIELADHRSWFRRRLSQGPMWIVEDNGAPVGVVRLDPGPDVAWISIALAPDARGRGIGRRAIEAACASYAQPVNAMIRVRNTVSRACFQACGFVLTSVTEDVVTYRWSP